ncbi:hypothetical protein [Asticcacaulis excentricus]|uniref:TolA protein n=1 Tax=Asticcacaulis excentricus (strain ATCC 15261 / DSM 4724 / KCTC 12464 / NCIMB 9791 / VKM B-1370 / CB 48) TaxID=573065 RepID=E8RPB0_ASTEC|nr:hypothetical protein [Asticcacaulis excentricus]ADU11956.1 hypothetical protein Astex_0258 [Asticcacaulis excentricus CB 48]
MNIGTSGISGQNSATATVSDLNDRLKLARAQKTEAQKTAAETLSEMPKKTRDDARARAKAKVMQLVERLKIIKELGKSDPKIMAKMLANLMKELKAAVKDYAKAGGNDMDMSGFSAAQSAASQPVPDSDAETQATEAAEETAVSDDEAFVVEDRAAEATPSAETDAPSEATVTYIPTPADIKSAAEAYVKTERQRAEGELMEVNDFMKQVRGLVKVVKDLFETAKIKLAFQKVDKDTVEAFKSSGKDMEEIDKVLQDLNKGLDDERVVYGPRAAIYA